MCRKNAYKTHIFAQQTQKTSIMSYYTFPLPNNNACTPLAIDYFAKAFKNMDLELIVAALYDNGNFKGENKETFSNDLRRLFSGLSQMQMTIHPYFGIAKSLFPGAPVVEFHIEIHDGDIINSFYLDDFFGKTRGGNFLIMKYGLLSDHEKGIYHIFEPDDCISMVETQRIIKLN